MESLRVVIELAIAQTSFRAAYVYRFEAGGEDGQIISFVGFPVAAAPEGRASAGHRQRSTPVVVHAEAWKDPRFGTLPEFRAHRFECVVSVPIVEAGAVVGMANFCRKEAGAVRPREVALLVELGLPLASLIAAPPLREQLARTEQRLASRKVVERAKGLLQERLGFTEEEAYLHLRDLSRRRRTPMREIAERLVENSRRRSGSHDFDFGVVVGDPADIQSS